MTNPFEDENGQYVVLVNQEIEYSLWPSFREVPAGWSVALTVRSRRECLEWIEANWTDMRPKSLIEAMKRN